MRPSLNLELLKTGDRLLVGLSGGVDSLALLHLLASERTRRQWELLAVHVHHGMRGEAANDDVEFLKELCAAWHVTLLVEHADVPLLAAERRISVEEAGRDARYAAFARVSRELGCNKVVTAHHADDQAETVLLHLFRGAGIDGLAAMPERRPLSMVPGTPELVRPLLQVRRRELEEYCREQGLKPRQDVTNLDLNYRRNRIRHELLPVLRDFDPAIVEHLVRLALQAREEMELLSVEADRLLQSAAVETAPAEFGIPLPALPPALTLDLERLRQAPPALLRRGLRLALRQAGEFDVEQSTALIERLVQLVNSDSGSTDLPGAPLRASNTGEQLRIEPRARVLTSPRTVEVALPGETDVPIFGLHLTAALGPIPDQLRLPPCRAILDFDSLLPPFQLRVPVPGDRFHPFNAPGSRLASDLFVDRKVPAYLRANWPILTDREGIIWVLGLAIAHRARIRPGTSRALHLAVVTENGSTLATGPIVL